MAPDLPRMAFGGDYNPDQWPEDTIAEDIDAMRRAHVNLVTLPVFSWSRLEPAAGRFEFDWLDRIIDQLWTAGIAVDLATATATPPAWLVRAHPEILPVRADGVRFEYGSRETYCPSSPVFREHAARLVRALGEHYRGHPAIALWHVSNEYGDELSRCYCSASADAFRDWLRARYGDIDALNDAWGTSCWGQTYRDWNHIEPPRVTTGPPNLGQLLDYDRFSSDAFIDLFDIEATILRETCPGVPLTTNFMGLFRDVDYRKLASRVDVVTDDAYPDPADPDAPADIALTYSFLRSAKPTTPWLLLESATGAVSWREVNAPKPPGKLRLDALQAIAHGSNGALFFQWRAARFGPEKFHSALLGHRGERSRTFREASALGKELSRIEAVSGTWVRADVGMVVDWDSWWALSEPTSRPSTRLDYLDQLRRWHRSVFRLGHQVRIAAPEGPFGTSPMGEEAHAVTAGGSDGPLPVLLVPNGYVVTDEQAAALSSYVEAGGHLVVGPFTGVLRPDATIADGGAPGPLRDLLGVEVDEWWPLPEGVSAEVRPAGDGVATSPEGAAWRATDWREWLEADPGVEIVATYGSGPLADAGALEGRPAITRRRLGVGTATYVSANLAPADLDALLASELAAAGLGVPPLNAAATSGLEVVTRTDGLTDYVFVLNHATTTVSYRPPAGGRDLVTGEVSAELLLPPHAAVVLTVPARKER